MMGAFEAGNAVMPGGLEDPEVEIEPLDDEEEEVAQERDNRDAESSSDEELQDDVPVS